MNKSGEDRPPRAAAQINMGGTTMDKERNDDLTMKKEWTELFKKITTQYELKTDEKAKLLDEEREIRELLFKSQWAMISFLRSKFPELSFTFADTVRMHVVLDNLYFLISGRRPKIDVPPNRVREKAWVEPLRPWLRSDQANDEATWRAFQESFGDTASARSARKGPSASSVTSTLSETDATYPTGKDREGTRYAKDIKDDRKGLKGPSDSKIERRASSAGPGDDKDGIGAAKGEQVPKSPSAEGRSPKVKDGKLRPKGKAPCPKAGKGKVKGKDQRSPKVASDAKEGGSASSFSSGSASDVMAETPIQKARAPPELKKDRKSVKAARPGESLVSSGSSSSASSEGTPEKGGPQAVKDKDRRGKADSELARDQTEPGKHPPKSPSVMGTPVPLQKAGDIAVKKEAISSDDRVPQRPGDSFGQTWSGESQLRQRSSSPSDASGSSSDVTDSRSSKRDRKKVTKGATPDSDQSSSKRSQSSDKSGRPVGSKKKASKKPHGVKSPKGGVKEELIRAQRSDRSQKATGSLQLSSVPLSSRSTKSKTSKSRKPEKQSSAEKSTKSKRAGLVSSGTDKKLHVKGDLANQKATEPRLSGTHIEDHSPVRGPRRKGQMLDEAPEPPEKPLERRVAQEIGKRPAPLPVVRGRATGPPDVADGIQLREGVKSSADYTIPTEDVRAAMDRQPFSLGKESTGRKLSELPAPRLPGPGAEPYNPAKDVRQSTRSGISKDARPLFSRSRPDRQAGLSRAEKRPPARGPQVHVDSSSASSASSSSSSSSSRLIEDARRAQQQTGTLSDECKGLISEHAKLVCEKVLTDLDLIGGEKEKRARPFVEKTLMGLSPNESEEAAFDSYVDGRDGTKRCDIYVDFFELNIGSRRTTRRIYKENWLDEYNEGRLPPTTMLFLLLLAIFLHLIRIQLPEVVDYHF